MTGQIFWFRYQKDQAREVAQLAVEEKAALALEEKAPELFAEEKLPTMDELHSLVSKGGACFTSACRG